VIEEIPQGQNETGGPGGNYHKPSDPDHIGDDHLPGGHGRPFEFLDALAFRDSNTSVGTSLACKNIWLDYPKI
jgi:hypothetical protein